MVKFSIVITMKIDFFTIYLKVVLLMSFGKLFGQWHAHIYCYRIMFCSTSFFLTSLILFQLFEMNFRQHCIVVSPFSLVTIFLLLFATFGQVSRWGAAFRYSINSENVVLSLAFEFYLPKLSAALSTLMFPSHSCFVMSTFFHCFSINFVEGRAAKMWRRWKIPIRSNRRNKLCQREWSKNENGAALT